MVIAMFACWNHFHHDYLNSTNTIFHVFIVLIAVMCKLQELYQ